MFARSLQNFSREEPSAGGQDVVLRYSRNQIIRRDRILDFLRSEPEL